MTTNKWLIGFFAVATINLIAVLAGQQTLIWISKPLMMPLLALWLWNTTPASRLRNGWLIGLAFSTLGDILLMFPGSLNFLLGLSAFLLAHVSYIWAIRTGLPQERGFLRQQRYYAPAILFHFFISMKKNNRLIGKVRGLEGWKVGRLERLEGWRGWKVGRLEGWKVGRLEGWKVGRLRYKNKVV